MMATPANNLTGVGNGVQGAGGPGSLLPGFQLLNWLLVNHTTLPEIGLMIYLLIGLMVGKAQLRTSSQLDFETIWSCLFGVNQGGQPIAALGGRRVPIYCPEAITVLFAIMRAIMNPESSARPDN